MKIRAIIVLSVALTVAGGLIHKFLSAEQKQETARPPDEGALESQGEKEGHRSSELAPETEVRQQVSSSSEIIVSPHAKIWQEHNRAEDLKKYAHLSEKALLLEPDRLIKRRLLADEGFLRGLELLLKTPPVDEDSRQAQDAALDFVLEALKTDLRSVAVEVLKAVVGDPAVESQDMPARDRQVLAGLKAEALFHWSAVDPEAGTEIPGLLPGKVSEKIWENVQKQQENNLAESASL